MRETLQFDKAFCPETDDTYHCVYKLASATGTALLSSYAVFPGISILYLDVHDENISRLLLPDSNLFTVMHCCEGRLEYEYNKNYHFLSQGDLSVGMSGILEGRLLFPTRHFHGICVVISPERAPQCLSCFLKDVNVQPERLIEKFRALQEPFVTRSSQSVEHIFSELYHVPREIQKGYFKVKILELMLFLSVCPVGNVRRSYSSSQIELAKQVASYLECNADRKVTTAELSRIFCAAAPTICAAFIGVYGKSPAAYLRAQKMHVAAALLRSTDRTVLDIAGECGYDNASKFARTFREIIGVSPNAYRIGTDSDSCAPSTYTDQ